jgi:hypothetical protein
MAIGYKWALFHHNVYQKSPLPWRPVALKAGDIFHVLFEGEEYELAAALAEAVEKVDFRGPLHQVLDVYIIYIYIYITHIYIYTRINIYRYYIYIGIIYIYRLDVIYRYMI